MANQLFKRMTLCRIQLDNYIFDLYYQLTPASLALETKSDLETLANSILIVINSILVVPWRFHS